MPVSSAHGHHVVLLPRHAEKKAEKPLVRQRATPQGRQLATPQVWSLEKLLEKPWGKKMLPLQVVGSPEAENPVVENPVVRNQVVENQQGEKRTSVVEREKENGSSVKSERAEKMGASCRQHCFLCGKRGKKKGSLKWNEKIAAMSCGRSCCRRKSELARRRRRRAATRTAVGWKNRRQATR